MTKLTDREFERLLKPLANRRRIGIIRFLKARKEATVSDIADAIKLSFRSTSKHLGLLASAEIVEREQRSLQMFYSIPRNLPPVVAAVISLV